MNRIAVIILLITSIAIFQCSNQRTIKAIKQGPILIAWNEDTLSPIVLSFFKKQIFIYSIKQGTENSQVSGKFKTSNDTIYLNYEKQPPPPGFSHFLINSPGGYLIQNYPPDSKRLALKIKNQIPF